MILPVLLTALVCSSRCPAALVLPAYDLASALRDHGVAVVSGFHTPIERDCLHFLLKGTQPVVVCPARSTERMRIPPEWREAVAAGRLHVVSPFGPEQRRATAALAAARNQFVAELATAAVIIHAAPGSRTERWCSNTLASGKPVFALDAPENALLFESGARRFTMADLLAELGAPQS